MFKENKTPLTKEDETEGYIPNKSLVKFLEDMIHFQKKKRELKHAGEGFSVDEQKRVRELKRMKNYYLNKHIFPSMANLVVFFEYISNSPDLQKVFDDDIYELLFRGNENGSNSLAVYHRFVESTIKWDVKHNPKSFRLELVHSLQNIIFQNLPLILGDIMAEEKYSTEMGNIIRQDLSRANLWAKITAGRAEYQSYDHKRPVRF